MPLLLLDARTGNLREAPAGPARVAFSDEWRAQAVAGPVLAILSASRAPEEGAQVFLGSRPPAGREVLWLKLGPCDAPPEDSEAARWLCWKTAYGQPLRWDAAGLEAAGRELAWVKARRAELQGAPAANESALSGYLQRLRQALAQDLGAPEAFACLSAALRPGALSPGTQAAFLKRFLEIFPVS